jgi:glycosyltransferase involved in cell wall biosynthesis
MPMTIIEALSIGTIPIIAYSINTEKMVDDKINAILYDPNEIDGLKKALIYFEGLTDQERLNMSAAGIQKYHAMYTEKAHMDKIIEIYFN